MMDNQTIRNAKLRHFHDITQATRQPSKIWGSLRTIGLGNKRTQVDSIPIPLDQLNDHFISTQSMTLDEIEKQQTILDLQRTQLPTTDKFHFSYVTELDVRTALKGITTKAEGIDKINIKMLDKILHVILPTLTHIFNASLITAIYPTMWKKAFIRPLPKNKSPTCPDDYRPISILPALSKVLERIVHRQLNAYLTEHCLLDDYQSGFRTGHSTTTALLKVNEDIREAADDRKLTLLTLLDFSKAFDTVDNDILLCKLRLLNLSDTAVSWFESYLHDRQQCLLVGSSSSEWRVVRSGVPQGSVLGPLLFTIYINDVTNSIKNCKHMAYADDLQIYYHFRTDDADDAVNKMNDDLTSISIWANKFGLKLNPGKSQAIVIGHHRLLTTLDSKSVNNIYLNNQVIEYSKTVRNLGIYMDNDLNWNTQVTHTCKKTLSLLHSMNHMKKMLPLSIKKNLIQTLVMPHFDYCDSLFTNINFKLSERLQRVHNICIRFICNTRKYDHITPSLELLSWVRLKERRILHALSLLYKILNNSSPNYLVSRFNFLKTPRHKNQSLLIIPRHTTSQFSSSFTIMLPRLWNSLPSIVRDCRTIYQFEIYLEKHIYLQGI